MCRLPGDIFKKSGCVPVSARIDVSQVRFVGNAAALGAKMALRSRGDRERASRFGASARHINLGTDPEFQMNFGMAVCVRCDGVPAVGNRAKVCA